MSLGDDLPPLLDLDEWEGNLDDYPPDLSDDQMYDGAARAALDTLQRRAPHLRGIEFLHWMIGFFLQGWCRPGLNPGPLPRRPGELEAYVTRVSDAIIQSTAARLERDSNQKCRCWHLLLKRMLAVTLLVVFPNQLRTRHSTPLGDVTVTAFQISNSLFELILNPGTPGSRMLRRFLPPGEARALDPDVTTTTNAEWRRRFRQLVHRQREGNGAARQAPAGWSHLYGWTAPGLRYLGKVHHKRATRNRAGLTVRTMEHSLWRKRPRFPEGRRRRYELGRRTRDGDQGMLILRSGHENMIGGMETFSINVEDANGNDRKLNRHGPGREPEQQRLRRRPNRAMRRQFPRPEQPGPLESRQAQAFLWKYHPKDTPAHKEAAEARVAAWAKPFGDTYGIELQRFSRRHGPGALNIHSRAHKRLAILYLAGAGHNLDFDILTTTWQRETQHLQQPIRTKAEALTELADLIDLLKKIGRTTTVTWKINRELLACGLPTAAKTTIRVQIQQQIATTKKAINAGLRSLPGYPWRVTQWLKRRLRYTVSGDDYLTRCRSAATVAKTGKVGEIVDITEPELSILLQGEDLQRIPGSTRIPWIAGQRELRGKVAADIGRAGWNLRIPHPLRDSMVQSGMKTVREVPNIRLSENDNHRYQTFASRFTRTHPEMVTQPKDKSPSESWDRTRRGYLLALLFFSLLAGWEWLPSEDHDSAHFAVLHALEAGWPARWRFMLRKLWTQTNNACPYLYMTIKLKCYNRAGGRKCTSSSHSCQRKIVSYWFLPFRTFLRRIHRALQLVMMQLLTFELWNLGDSTPQIRRGIGKLRTPERFRNVCQCCGKVKGRYEMATADAGQFYEQVHPDTASACVDYCLDAVMLRTGCSTVTQIAGRGVQGGLGGMAPDFVPRTKRVMVFRFSELKLWFRTIIHITIVRVLNLVFLIHHTPIGNPFGKVAVSATAGWYEYCWLSRKMFLALPWWDGNTPWEDVICILRYVDDLLLISGSVCADCLLGVVEDVYPFTFDPGTKGHKVEWCDSLLRMTDTGYITVTPNLKNTAFALGKSSDKDRETLPPPFLCRGIRTDSGIFRGFLVRWAQINDHPKILMRCGWQKTVEYLAAGYSVGYMKRVWGRTPHSDTRDRIFKLLNLTKHLEHSQRDNSALMRLLLPLHHPLRTPVSLPRSSRRAYL